MKDSNYNGVCCINIPIVAVFLDQKSFPYLLISGDYEYDFLDHFMELDISKELAPSRTFDLLLCNLSGINIPMYTTYRMLTRQFKSSKDKIVLTQKNEANKFIQSGLFSTSENSIANLIPDNMIALSV